ncbi:MAG: ribonuclease H-like domain-containing protein [Candidatus Levybacteria bacterium]|nr:ribonuclease H-like domain-containing protein [Candidatus Levybacteria bacterium]
MNKLFFDIETIPSAEEHKDMHVGIIKKLDSKKGKTAEEIHEKTSLEGTFGRICCIGIIKEGPTGIIQKDVFFGTEKEILTQFWKAAADVQQFIGHNIWNFDLPFIYKRSIINSVRPRRDINFARYRNLPIYDTQQEWELWGYQKAQKLDTLAKVLGLPTSKDEMDGSMVWKYHKKGKIADICNYCMKDVELTRQVYYKMTFEDFPSSSTPRDINF